MKQTILLFLFLAFCCCDLYGQGLHKRDQHLPCLEKNFNVFTHLSVDSVTRRPYVQDWEVDELMAKMSEFFSPICMSFSSCEIQDIVNYTFHNLVDDSLRIEELGVLYGRPNRINVYILGTIPNGECGHSIKYGINDEEGIGGYIFLETECYMSLEGQLAHHLGHFFGLQDTYHGSLPEIVDDPNCAIVGDSICDTPTDPFGIYSDSLGVYFDVPPLTVGMGNFVRNCEFVHEPLDPNGQYYQPQVGNIMSAYPCQCGFTNEQFEKIVRIYNGVTTKPY